MSGSLIDRFPVLSFMADTEDQLSLTGLCRILQDAAWKHATSLGFGPRDLAERGLMWILSRLLVRVTSYPQWSEIVEVETWPSGVDRLFAMRDFRLTGAGGQPIALVRSAWLGIDAVTRRPMPPGRFIDVASYADAPTVFAEAPQKLSPVGSDAAQVGRHTVVYSDFDRQRHVNNVQYLQWMMDTFDFDFLRGRVAGELTINFQAEATYREEVVIRRVDNGNRSDLTVFSPAENVPVATARLAWRDR